MDYSLDYDVDPKQLVHEPHRLVVATWMPD